MSSVLSQKDEKVIGSESNSGASSSSGMIGSTGKNVSGAKEEDICDDWEQLDQQVKIEFFYR